MDRCEPKPMDNQVREILEQISRYIIQPYAGAKYECLFCGNTGDHKDFCISNRAIAILAAELNPKSPVWQNTDKDIAHELFPLFQLQPGEGVEDAVDRCAPEIARIQKTARARRRGGCMADKIRESLQKAVDIYSQYRTNCKELRSHFYRDWYENAKALLTTKPGLNIEPTMGDGRTHDQFIKDQYDDPKEGIK